MGSNEPPLAPGAARRPGRGVAVVHALALAGAVLLTALTAGTDRWDPVALLVIVSFSTVSAVTSVEAGSSRLNLSGDFLGIVLAAVLLGGAPAAVVGVTTTFASWLRRREPGHRFRQNLVTYAWFPLAGGLGFHAVMRLAHIPPGSAGYYPLVFATFIVSLAMNFLAIAGYTCHLDGTTLAGKAREALIPVLSAELFSALLTISSVYVALNLGTIGLALFGAVLILFQHLVGELLTSQSRATDLHRLATTDELTGLANRNSFHAAVQRRIDALGAPGEPFAVMLLDLDRFKEINDALGHHCGDELLGQLGPRLAACVGPGGFAARLGGDEFALLPAASGSTELLELAATQVVACVQEPVMLEEMILEVGASIGISRYPRDGEDPHALLRCADVAMYAAKDAHAGWKFYDAELDRHSVRRLSVLSDFRRALSSESDEIIVHYQPIVEASSAAVRGAEGLARWDHPKHGMIPAGDFIATVEHSGLIGPLTRHVLERAVSQCAAWHRQGRPLTVAVNLSVRNLLEPSLPRTVESLLAAHHLPPEALHLEITESVLMSDPERSLTTLLRLSELGVRLSVDDFGTGYSSLATLRRFPIDQLKIDRSFVSPILRDESDLIIVRSTINLAHDLGLRVVAEGVEDEPTLQHLASLGCDLAQGYHLSRPLAAPAFSQWVDDADPRTLSRAADLLVVPAIPRALGSLGPPHRAITRARRAPAPAQLMQALALTPEPRRAEGIGADDPT